MTALCWPHQTPKLWLFPTSACVRTSLGFLQVWNVNSFLCIWTHVSPCKCKLLTDPTLLNADVWVSKSRACFLVSVLETHREQVKGGLSMFLESVRQEMPSAHLELLYSGSLCMTAETFEVLPGHLNHQTFFVPLSWSMWRLPAFYSWPNSWFRMRFGDWWDSAVVEIL